jgi:hypothetical protein
MLSAVSDYLFLHLSNQYIFSIIFGETIIFRRKNSPKDQIINARSL